MIDSPLFSANSGVKSQKPPRETLSDFLLRLEPKYISGLPTLADSTAITSFGAVVIVDTTSPFPIYEHFFQIELVG